MTASTHSVILSSLMATLLLACASTVHRVRGVESAASAWLTQQRVEEQLVQLISSDAHLSQPRNWRPLVHWLLFVECTALDAIAAFEQQSAPIDLYLGSGGRGTNELAFIQASAGKSAQDIQTGRLPANSIAALATYEVSVFQRFLQALFFRGITEFPEQFRGDRQLGSLWLLQMVYYNDIPQGLVRKCDTFSQHHSVRFARMLANRQDLHFQWYNPPPTHYSSSTQTPAEIPPEKACECTALNSGEPASEVCAAMHCESALACSLHGQQRMCVHSDASSFVCTCAGHHGFVEDLD